MTQKHDNSSAMAEVLGRCRKAFLDFSGQERLFTRDFTSEELRARRKNIAKRIGNDAHVLIPGAPPQPGHLASQDATFYYFTGLDVFPSYLLVDGRDGHSTLFLPSRDEMEGEPADRWALKKPTWSGIDCSSTRSNHPVNWRTHWPV